MVLAVGLVVVGIAFYGIRLATLATLTPLETGLAVDVHAYYLAAERMLVGESPYLAAQVADAGVGHCHGCYLYPPFFAQLFAPLTLVPLTTAKLIWIAISYMAAFASVWLAIGLGGAARSRERAAWCVAAVLLFDPVAFDTLNGNVGSVVALGVALVATGGAAAGVSAGFIAALKVAPATLLPAVFVSGRDARVTLIATLVVVAGASFLLAPQAWLDYPATLRNVWAAPADNQANFAFNQIVADLGWSADAVAFVRVMMVLLAGGCILASIWVARRKGGMPAAAVLGTAAMLVMPGTLWFHCLAVLLPFAAMALTRAGARAKGLLLTGMILVGMTPHLEQGAVAVSLGWVLSLGTAAWVLWPVREVEAVAQVAPSGRYAYPPQR